ncbi:hypothetical protein [Actinoplanes sp. HUAS TT8]|uniref:hypothetical protein n=1 Tax=Actinoplanes sp. HUAS TT8 TaxID=3447453 RepID=UPI003F528AB8
MGMDSVRGMLHESLRLLRVAMLAVFGSTFRPLDDSLVDTEAAPAFPVIGHERTLIEQFTASIGDSRAPPALSA